MWSCVKAGARQGDMERQAWSRCEGATRKHARERQTWARCENGHERILPLAGVLGSVAAVSLLHLHLAFPTQCYSCPRVAQSSPASAPSRHPPPA